jgi:hypothetical protein
MNILQNVLAYSPIDGNGLFQHGLLVLLYLGPESIMPIASIIAALLGFVLIFWRWIINFFKKLFKRSKGVEAEVSDEAPAETYKDPLDE